MKHFLLAALLLGVALAQAPVDTYVYQTSFKVDTLDPAQAYDAASLAIIENIYETLYTYAGESVTETEPLLATSYEISEDGTVYTFKLRDGVTFHSGNPMTCRDVEYSVERALVSNPPDAPTWFLAESLLGSAANANDALGEGATGEMYASYWQRLDASVECLDDLTVRFTLPQADPAFFAKLMYPGNGVVDSAWAIQNGMWDGTADTWRAWVGVDLRDSFMRNHMSGTGAYRLVSWDSKDVVAEAFDAYWGGEPALKRVVVQLVEEPSTRVLTLKRGDADSVYVPDRAGLKQLSGVEGITVHEQDDWVTTAVNQIVFNASITTEDNPDVGSGKLGGGIPADFFADPDMRKCVAYSFDQRIFIKEALLDKGVTLTMGLPPSYLGYDPTLPVYDLDLEKAEAACRAAHGGQVWEEGFTFTALITVGDSLGQTALDIIQSNLSSLNPKFHLKIRNLSWPDFLDTTSQGAAPLFVIGWQADYADPDNFLYPFYASDGLFSYASHFGDTEMDTLLNKARATTDQDERAALYQQVGAKAFELVPMFPMPTTRPFIVARSSLQGVSYNPMRSGYFLWKDLSKN